MLAKNFNKTDENNVVEKSLFLGVVLMFISLQLVADNYLVSTTYEIDEISDLLQAGDTILMQSGDWTDVEIVLEFDGSEDMLIVLMPEETGMVILNGASNLRIYGTYIEVNGLRFEDGYSPSGAIVEFRNGSSELASNCRLTNCTFKDYNPSDLEEDYKWVSIYGQYNRVDHCEFSGKSHSGTTLVVWLGSDTPNYTQIDHNYFGSRPDLGYNGGETIRIGTSTNSMEESYAIVEYNVFEECDGEIEIISNKSCFNNYRYNTFRDCDGCLTLRHGNDCSVYGNFFFGEDKFSGGVRIIGERHQVYNNYFEGLEGDDYRSAICLMNGVPDSDLNRYFQVQDAVVVFNTIVECKMPVIIGAGKDDEKTLAPYNCTFANNVIDKTTGSINVEIEDAPTDMTWLGNVVNGDEDDEDVSVGFVFANPNLVNEESLWRPSSTSILIDAAEGEYTDVTDDIDNVYSRDDVKDVGCDEYGYSIIENRPLVQSDVGPYSEEDGEDELDSSIYSGREEVDDMVSLDVCGNTLKLNVSCNYDCPVEFVLFDLSGKIIKNGSLNKTSYIIVLPDRVQIVLASFISQSKYYQSNKILTRGL